MALHIRTLFIPPPNHTFNGNALTPCEIVKNMYFRAIYVALQIQKISNYLDLYFMAPNLQTLSILPPNHTFYILSPQISKHFLASLVALHLTPVSH